MLLPLAKVTIEAIAPVTALRLKEIVIVVPEKTNDQRVPSNDPLQIVHRYLLLYDVAQ